MNTIIRLLWLCSLAPISALAQGTFKNLGFEDAVGPLAVGAVSTQNALPNWIAYLGEWAPDYVGYDVYTTAGAGVSLWDRGESQYSALLGNYSVLLQGKLYPEAPGAATAGIGQVGLIPSDAKTVRFLGRLGNDSFPALLTVTFNGQEIPFTQLGQGSRFNIYGGDISQFAGQTGELRFTCYSYSGALLDQVHFSPEIVPEPGVLSLICLGVVGLLWRRRANS